MPNSRVVKFKSRDPGFDSLPCSLRSQKVLAAKIQSCVRLPVICNPKYTTIAKPCHLQRKTNVNMREGQWYEEDLRRNRDAPHPK